MTKPLLIACIVLSVGAAALGFLNGGKLTEAVAQVQNTESQLTVARQELQAAKTQLDTKTQELSNLASTKETALGELNAAREEVAKAKADLTAALEKVTAAEAEVTQLKSDGEAKDTRIAELEKQTTAPAADTAVAGGPQVEELQARLTELETVNQQLQDQNTGLTTQVSELRRKEDNRQKGLMRPGISGTILAVNQAWNFVVLSLGDRQGVVPNAEMLVQRDGRFLGRIRVTSVEPSTSIADILVRTVPRGFSIMPGDRVVYASTGD